MAETEPQRNVYQLIAVVSAEIAKSGIAKERQNAEQKYKFRGIDDVYNTLAPILARHGLVILPRILSRLQTERLSSKGNPIFVVVVEAEFDFVSSHDGSTHTVRTFGEAMDTADKATNKAMSAAYKYAAFQAFCIPTEGDNDADASHHEVVAAPEGYELWATMLDASLAKDGIAVAREDFAAGKPEYREYFTKVDKTRYDRFKAAAAKQAAAA